MPEYRCADCGQPVTAQYPGAQWGRGRWCHHTASICIAALGAAVKRLEDAARPDEGERWRSPCDEHIAAWFAARPQSEQ